MRLQVKEVASYGEDVVFLVVPDGSAFGRTVPLVIGTCTLARVINVIKESEMDKISTPWATVHLAQLLSRLFITEESRRDENTAGEEIMDEIVKMKDNVCVGPFQTDFERKGCTGACKRYVMVVPVRRTEVVQGKAHLLPPDYKCCMRTPCSQLEVSKFR